MLSRVIRFTPVSGHRQADPARPKSAKKRQKTLAGLGQMREVIGAVTGRD
jgi:hypothetical protein